MSDPISISTQGLSLINNVVIDAQKLGTQAETHAINDAYAAMHGSRMDLCEYVARLERQLGIGQMQVVKR